MSRPTTAGRVDAHLAALTHLLGIVITTDNAETITAVDALLERTLPIGSLKVADKSKAAFEAAPEDLNVVLVPSSDHDVEHVDNLLRRERHAITRQARAQLLHNASPSVDAVTATVGDGRPRDTTPRQADVSRGIAEDGAR